MWIFCLFLFNAFVFVKLYRLLPDLQKHLFALFHFRRAIRRLAPQGGQTLHSALRAPLEHESLRTVAREVLLRFLMARHAKGIRQCRVMPAPQPPRAIRRLAPCGAKLFASLEHESLRTVVRERSVTFSLWRATQKGIRQCRVMPAPQPPHAIRRLAPQGDKALRFARARIPTRCRA